MTLYSEFPSNHKVRVRHPGYPPTKNTLFVFNAYDHLDGGIKKSFLMTACGVVAGNAWYGYISRDLSDAPVLEEMNEVLVGRNFYYHHHPYSALDPKEPCCCVTQPYAVFTDFASWPFPHDNLPPWWPSIDPCPHAAIRISDTSSAVKARDLSCRVTGSIEAGETAHVVAVKEQGWFQDERMYEYSDDALNINSAGNQLLLRVDLHRTHEQFKWVIFPNGSQYVYYALESPELASLYHQRRLRSIDGVKSEYLLAAYARAILPKLREFLGTRTDKYLLLVGEDSDESLSVKKPGDWCVEQFRPPVRPRSASPNKRGSPSKEGSPNKRPRNEAAISQHAPIPDDLSPSPGTQLLGKRRQASDADDPSLVSDDDNAHPRKRLKPRNPRYTGPCTCRPLPPSPPSSSPKSKGVPSEPLPVTRPKICLSDNCRTRIDLERLDCLRQKHLEKERLASDPHQTWKAQLDWTNDPAAIQDVRRWLWVTGQDVVDDEK